MGLRPHYMGTRAAALALVAFAVLAAAGVGFSAAPASASVTPGAASVIVSPPGLDTAYLDADANTLPANGTKVQTWGSTGGLNQRWIFHYHSVPDFSWWTITNQDGGQCLDADARTLPANGTKVQMWACNGGTNQDWTIYS